MTGKPRCECSDTRHPDGQCDGPLDGYYRLPIWTPDREEWRGGARTILADICADCYLAGHMVPVVERPA